MVKSYDDMPKPGAKKAHGVEVAQASSGSGLNIKHSDSVPTIPIGGQERFQRAQGLMKSHDLDLQPKIKPITPK